MLSTIAKKLSLRMAAIAHIDVLGRFLNKNRLLTVMYHGITNAADGQQVWTQLPVDRFKSQLEFLRKHYLPVSLGEVLEAIASEVKLPERAVLITFDDGLRNNCTVAFPILREMGIPATVFLTVDYIGSDKFLWVDELYLLLREASVRGIPLELPDNIAQRYFREGNVWKSYEAMVEILKRSGLKRRIGEMEKLRQLLPMGLQASYNDFRMLDWDDVRAMHQSGLISFGVHTATHRIVAELEEEDWKDEIVLPKMKLEKELGSPVTSFCFPNGHPFVDFRREHLDYLRKAGYSCAFTTQNRLFARHDGDPLQIGRVAVGNDVTSDMNYFRLNTSGIVRFVKEKMLEQQDQSYQI